MSGKKSKIVLICLIGVVGTVLVGTGVAMMEYNSANRKIKPVINDDVVKLPESQLAIKISAVVTFDNSTSVAPIEITNKPENIYDCIIEIYLENSNDLIYKSEKIYPGETINTIKLNKNLNKGKYTAVAYFNAYDENNSFKGKSGARITINVLN